MNKPKRESPIILKAFEYYYKLGADRRLVTVARRFKKSPQAVHAWAKAYKWNSRADEMDRDVQKKSLESFDNLLITAKEENLKIIRAAKISLVNQMKRLQVKGQNFPVTLADFERLAKLELLMLGDPTERISDDTITGLVKRAAESIRSRNNPKSD
ncbi:hypothetical protein LCGC14_1214840 [marine sediment metagenome]|uniref:Terminase small subunit n=1 Tax=marine sediment metagenome TaxID=412755 RepID=A0A0F9LD79_9ZZZZ